MLAERRDKGFGSCARVRLFGRGGAPKLLRGDKELPGLSSNDLAAALLAPAVSGDTCFPGGIGKWRALLG